MFEMCIRDSTHTYPLRQIEEAYRIFENKLDGVIKIAITADEGE